MIHSFTVLYETPNGEGDWHSALRRGAENFAKQNGLDVSTILCRSEIERPTGYNGYHRYLGSFTVEAPDDWWQTHYSNVLMEVE